MARKSKKKNILDKISSDEAFTILKTLAWKDKGIARRIEQTAIEVLRNVNIEEVADGIFSDLDNIKVEDVWNSSGRTRYGYVEPNERAGEMFEEALEPFLEELKRYQKLSMHTAAKSFCKGVLKGLYKFEKESSTEYADYVEDEPREYSKTVLDEWKKGCKNTRDKKEMKEFIKKNFPDWKNETKN